MMQLNRFLAVAIKIGTYVILFLPLVVFQGMFFPFITGKNFIFRIIIEIIFASWVVLFLRDKSYLPKRSLIFYFVLASVAVLTLATIFGADVSRSFWSNFERMEGLLGHLHLLMYFLVLVGINRTEKDWWRFFHVSFIASFSPCIIFLRRKKVHGGFYTLSYFCLISSLYIRPRPEARRLVYSADYFCQLLFSVFPPETKGGAIFHTGR